MRSLRVACCLALVAAACANTTTFHTNPRGANVYVNGEPCGESPCTYHTRYGFPERIRVQLDKPGYQSAELFLDSQPPLAAYLLFVFGAYLFHTFDEEYRFSLAPLPTAPAATPAAPPPATVPPVTAPPDPAAAPSR